MVVIAGKSVDDPLQIKCQSEKDLYQRYFYAASDAFETGKSCQEVQDHIKNIGKWESLSDMHARKVMLAARCFVSPEVKKNLRNAEGLAPQ